MSNLLEMVLNETKENVVKSTKKESINESLMELLYRQKMKLSRIDLIGHITMRRLEMEHGLDKLEKMSKEQFLKLVKSTNKTVKNGLDTSISRSQNNSSFHYNPKYKGYKFEEVEGLYQITKK